MMEWLTSCLWVSTAFLLLADPAWSIIGDCGPSKIYISIPESSGSTVSTAKSPQRLLIETDRSDLGFIFVEDQNPQNLTITYESGGVTQGFYVTVEGWIDREGPTDLVSDDINKLYFSFTCLDQMVGRVPLQLEITILDLNDNPHEFVGAPYSAYVTELSPVGTTVSCSIITKDLDLPNTSVKNYTLTTHPTSKFNITGIFTLVEFGEYACVVLAKEIDFDDLYRQVNYSSLVVYNLSLTVKDDFTISTELSIFITDGDDLGPVFSYDSCPRTEFKSCVYPRYETTIVSNTSSYSLSFLPVPKHAGQSEVYIRARDQDTLNASIKFQIAYTVPSGYETWFDLKTTFDQKMKDYVCLITLTKPVNRSDVSSLKVRVAAVQVAPLRQLQEEATIYVTVKPNLNDTFEIEANSNSGYICENAHLHTEVKADESLLTPLRFSLRDSSANINDPPENIAFTVVPNTTFWINTHGIMQLRSSAGFEAISTLYVQVTASLRGRSNTMRIMVNVIKVNESFHKVDNVLLDGNDYKTDHPFYTVDATEVDSNASLTFSVVSIAASPSFLWPTFKISSTGLLSVLGFVDNDTIYTLLIKISSGIPHSSNYIALTVKIRGSQAVSAPRFTANDYKIFVSEGVLLHSSLWSIPVWNPGGDKLIFKISMEKRQENIFYISSDAHNTVLHNKQLLDRENTSLLNFTLFLEDSSSRVDSAVVELVVTDINDNAPVFTQKEYNFTVSVDAAIGTFIGEVTANDSDEPYSENSAISYSFQESIASFEINKFTGRITTTSALDYKTSSSVWLTVLASDGGRDPLIRFAFVDIIITDPITVISDNIPLFEKQSYVFYVDEKQNNSFIGTVSVRRSSMNNSVTYRFAGGDSDIFQIDAVSGEIQALEVLEYKTQEVYVLWVTTNIGFQLEFENVIVCVYVIVQEIPDYSSDGMC